MMKRFKRICKVSLNEFCKKLLPEKGIIILYNENGEIIEEHFNENSGFIFKWISSNYASK